MKINWKLIRVSVAAFVGSVLWAGCSGPSFMVADEKTIAMAPIDMTKRRPDTHPEFLNGLYQTRPAASGGIYPVAETTTLIDPDPQPTTTADTTSLLVFNPEVVNIALGASPSVPVETSGGVIVEAAGAEPGAPARNLNWRERVIENRQRLEQIAP